MALYTYSKLYYSGKLFFDYRKKMMFRPFFILFVAQLLCLIVTAETPNTVRKR